MGIRKCRTSVVIAVTGTLLSGACGAGRAHAAGDPGGPACSPAQLTVSGRGVEGGLNHEGSVVIFTDHGEPCTMRGYPDLVGLREGRVLVRARHTTDGYLGGPRGVQTVRLTTGRSASAMYEGLLGAPNGEPDCPQYNRLAVTSPGAGRPLPVPRGGATFAACDLEVHPVVSGRTGTCYTHDEAAELCEFE
jgi:hypothetical protein